MPLAPSGDRRTFLRGAALAAAALPILCEAQLARAAGTAPDPMAFHGGRRRPAPENAVLINANENPLGPSRAARAAIGAMAEIGGRYDLNGETDALIALFAQQQGLPTDHVAVYAGSSEPLHFSVLAFTSPTRGFVTADPSYEAGMAAAAFAGAPISRVPLTPAFAHDIRAMVAADPKAGLIYICNPNNPTGTLTPRSDIVWALQNKPRGSVLLVDEAYIHLSEAPDVLDLVRQGGELIVLRTFSKVYGMAGIRCGFALARPDLLARLNMYGQNPMPVTGSAAARASLLDPDLVPQRRKIIADIRTATVQGLRSRGFEVVGEPQTNCFMIQTGRSGRSVIEALQKRNIYIGRTWPIWPNAVRVTVGTAEDMARFQAGFAEVMAA